MKVNGIVLFLILSITAPYSNASQLISESTQQEKKQQKPTLRSKLVKWGTIATGVAASIAVAVGVYFQATKRSAITNSEELLKNVSQTKDLLSLDQMYKQNSKSKYWNDTVESAYRGNRAVLEQELNNQIDITNKQQLLNALKATKTKGGLEVLIRRLSANTIGTPIGFKDKDSHDKMWKDEDFLDWYDAQRLLITVNEIREEKRENKLGPNSVEELIKFYIKDRATVNAFPAPYSTKRLIKLVDDEEVQRIANLPDIKQFLDEREKAGIEYQKKYKK